MKTLEIDILNPSPLKTLENYKVLNFIAAFNSGKSHCEAIRLKEEGNKYFVKGNFRKSLEKYNSAIGVVDDKKTFSVLLGNRSAAFYNLKQFESCLDDIEVAFKNNCTETLQLKLLERRARSVYSLGDKKKFAGEIDKPDLQFSGFASYIKNALCITSPYTIV